MDQQQAGQGVYRYRHENAEYLCMTGHNDIPEFMFEPDDVTAIVSYLETLREDQSTGP